jgi:hypothetical protein
LVAWVATASLSILPGWLQRQRCCGCCSVGFEYQQVVQTQMVVNFFTLTTNPCLHCRSSFVFPGCPGCVLLLVPCRCCLSRGSGVLTGGGVLQVVLVSGPGGGGTGLGAVCCCRSRQIGTSRGQLAQQVRWQKLPSGVPWLHPAVAAQVAGSNCPALLSWAGQQHHSQHQHHTCRCWSVGAKVIPDLHSTSKQNADVSITSAASLPD